MFISSFICKIILQLELYQKEKHSIYYCLILNIHMDRFLQCILDIFYIFFIEYIYIYLLLYIL